MVAKGASNLFANNASVNIVDSRGVLLTQGKMTLPGRSGCVYDLSTPCSDWCMKPAWTSTTGGSGLQCCGATGHTLAPDHSHLAADEMAYQILVAVLYTGEESLLRTQIKAWGNYSRDVIGRLRFLIAVETSGDVLTRDDSDKWWLKPSKLSSLAWEVVRDELAAMPEPQRPDVRLVALREHLDWNIGGKRNLLMKVASDWKPAGWVLLMDIDILISEKVMGQCFRIIGDEQNRGKIHKFNRVYENRPAKSSFHPGTWLLPSTLYWKAGACDEDFVGNYGWTDPHFDERAKRVGINVHWHPDMVLVNLEHTKEKRVRDARHNAKLLLKKKQGAVEWSNRYLRFGWGLVSCPS